MRQLRASRLRRTWVAACLPYLLLCVFVNFVHLHPLLNDSAPQISATNHVAPCPPGKTFDSSCALCQWMRAGAGLQAFGDAGPAVVLVADDVALPTTEARGSPARLPVALRGPPSPRFA